MIKRIGYVTEGSTMWSQGHGNDLDVQNTSSSRTTRNKQPRPFVGDGEDTIGNISTAGLPTIPFGSINDPKLAQGSRSNHGKRIIKQFAMHAQ